MKPVKLPIFLLGLMGAGKSFFGPKLATYLQCDFLDLDEALVEQEKMSVTDIFFFKGEDFFRQQEASLLRKLGNSQAVIATGGGTPCYFENMEYMKQHGTTIWVNPPLPVLVARLWKSKSNRPLIRSCQSEQELFQKLQALHEKRFPYYSQSRWIYNEALLSPTDIYNDLIAEKNI